MSRLLPLVAGAVLVMGCEQEREEPLDAPVAAVPASFTEHHLDNGIRVIVGERRGSGLVASSVLVRAGAVWETEALNGAAHFLEHLLFNGTTSRTQEELYGDVDKLGAYNNAATRKDYAIFMLLVGAESLEEGLSIHADMLFNSTLPPDKFEKEKGIVLEEIAKDRSSPSYDRGVVLDQVLYAGTPYAMPVLGTEASISGLERDEVLAYYRAHYTPSNMTVLLIGDMSADEMLAAAERTYGKAQNPADGAANASPAEPAPIEGTRRVHAPAESDETIVMLRLDAPELGSPEIAVFELLGNVLAGGRGARLHRAMAMEPALHVNDVGAGLTYVGGRTYFDVSAEVPVGTDPDSVAARIAGELARLVDTEVSEAEIASARVAFRADEASLREKIHYYGMMRADKILYSPVAALNEQAARHRRVTPAVLRASAERWLSSPDVLVAVVGPGLEPTDETVTLETLGFTVPETSLAGGGPEHVVDSREAPPRADAATPPHMVTLDNGMRVIVSSDPASNVLAMHLMALGASFREPAELAGITRFLQHMLTRGAGEWDAAALGSQLAAIGASVKTHDDPNIPYDDYYASPEFSYVRFETLDDYYQPAFSLLATMVTEPRFDAAEIERVRDELRQLAATDADNPVERARLAYRRVIYGEDSPGARPLVGTAETLARIDAEALRTYHGAYFAPSNLVLAVVTGLPDEVVLEQVAQHFTFGEVEHPVEPWSVDAVTPPVTGTPETIEENLGAPQSGVRLGWVFEFNPADEAALDVANLLLSDRMAFQLRERLGLAYSIGSSFSSWGHRGILTAAMGTRPENVEIALAGLAEQIDSLAVVAIDEETLQTAVNARVGRMRMRRITRMGQAFYLCMDVLAGEPLMAHDRRLVAMRAVNPQRLTQVAAMYLDADRANRVVVR